MLTKEDYNDIPVFYCRKCLSLCILEDSEYGDYCQECGSTDIGQIQIEEWEKLYNESLKEPDYGKGNNYKKKGTGYPR